MAFVRCPGCDATVPSGVPAYHGCGRCPACGLQRFDPSDPRDLWAMTETDGREVWGLRFDLPPCECGHPSAESRAKLERPRAGWC